LFIDYSLPDPEKKNHLTSSIGENKMDENRADSAQCKRNKKS